MLRDNGNLAAALEGSYPQARPRPLPTTPQTPEVYGRYEGTNTETTLGDTDSTVITFSGEPDLIVLTARTNGALFTLTDASGIEDRPIAVLPNQSQSVRLQRRVVRARNLVAGSNAAVMAGAFFARASEPYNR